MLLWHTCDLTWNRSKHVYIAGGFQKTCMLQIGHNPLPDTMCTLVDPEILYRVRDMNIIVELGHQYRYCVEARSGMGKAIDKRTKRGPIAL